MKLKNYTLTINRFGTAHRTIDRYDNMSFNMAKTIWNDNLNLYEGLGHVKDMTMRCEGNVLFKTTFRLERED